MVSLVSSEHAFSSAGITISNCRNQLKGDIVDALQCLKCWLHYNLIFWVDPNSSLAAELADEDNVIEEGDDPDSTGQCSNFQDESTCAWDNMWLITEDGEDIELFI